MRIGQPEGDDVNRLRRTVISRYSVIPQVVAIYCTSAIAGQITFWIFTGETRLDWALRDMLLSEELRILDEYPDLKVSIDYFPAIIYERPAEITGDNAELVFTRE